MSTNEFENKISEILARINNTPTEIYSSDEAEHKKESDVQLAKNLKELIDVRNQFLSSTNNPATEKEEVIMAIILFLIPQIKSYLKQGYKIQFPEVDQLTIGDENAPLAIGLLPTVLFGKLSIRQLTTPYNPFRFKFSMDVTNGEWDGYQIGD